MSGRRGPRTRRPADPPRLCRSAARRAAAARAAHPMRGARTRTRGRQARPGWLRTLVPVAIVAILLVFTASTLFSLATRRSDALLAAQLTADHVKCFTVFDSPDATSLDARTRRTAARRFVRLERPRASVGAAGGCAARRRAPLPVRGRQHSARDVPRERRARVAVHARRGLDDRPRPRS